MSSSLQQISGKEKRREGLLPIVLDGGMPPEMPFLKMGKAVFYELKVSYPCYFGLLFRLSTLLILSASKFPKVLSGL